MARSHSQSPGAGIHFKAGGSLGRLSFPGRGAGRPAFPKMPTPLKTPNPFKAAKMMVRRTTGLAKAQKGRPY